MAGGNHTGRRPTRLSSIGKRDARSIADRRRVAEADIRQSVYVRPLGPAYDVFKNPCNDQEYVAANGTGSTHTAGQVVPLGSFSGNPGEFSFGRPPAGFGGASGYSVNKVSSGFGFSTPNAGTGAATSGWGNTFVQAADAASNLALWIGTGSRDGGSTFECLLVSLPVADLPVTFEQAVAKGSFRVVGSFGSNALNPLALYVAPGPVYVALFDTVVAGVNDSTTYFLRSMDSEGNILATSASFIGPDSNFFGSDGQAAFGFCVSGGSFFLIEPREEDPVYSTPPDPTGRRVTKRNPHTLELLAEYDLPSVSPNWGQYYCGMAPNSGGVDLFFKKASGAVDYNLWRRPLSSALSAGSDTMFSDVGKDETNAAFSSGRYFQKIGTQTYFIGALNSAITVPRLYAVNSSTVSIITTPLTVRPVFFDRSASGVLVCFDGAGAAWTIETDGTEHLPVP